MMIRVWDVSVTPEQYSYFIEEGVLDYRTPFAIEVTSEELEMLESMVEKVDKPGWWGCSCVYKRALALFFVGGLVFGSLVNCSPAAVLGI